MLRIFTACEYGSQDSNNVETKMNLQACIGKPLLSRWGVKNPASSKAAAAAAATAAATLCQYIRGQSPTTEKKKDPSRGQNLKYDSWMTHVKMILFETLIFKDVYFDTMKNVNEKQMEQRIGTLYFQY